MNERGRITLRIIAGGYLAYLGIDLLKNVITGKPDNALLFGAVGVLFLAVGAWCLINAVRQYRKYQQSEYEDTEESEEAADENDIEEDEPGDEE